MIGLIKMNGTRNLMIQEYRSKPGFFAASLSAQIEKSKVNDRGESILNKLTGRLGASRLLH